MRPSKGKSLPFCAPVHNIMASYSDSNVALSISTPTSTPLMKVMPASSINLIRRRTTSLSSFIFGIPYINKPPDSLARS